MTLDLIRKISVGQESLTKMIGFIDETEIVMYLFTISMALI